MGQLQKAVQGQERGVRVAYSVRMRNDEARERLIEQFLLLRVTKQVGAEVAYRLPAKVVKRLELELRSAGSLARQLSDTGVA